MGEFRKVCKLSELEEKKGKRFLVDDVDVALFKVDGKVFAVSNVCPHQHAAKIYDGFIEDTKIVCPLHGWEFNLDNGKMFGGYSKLDCYEVTIEDDYIFVKVFKRELKW